jgi:hypothetical protein
MVHSHIVYCINIYSCANTSSLNRLWIKQKEAIRIISNAGFREHTAPLFAQLSILPLDHLIKLHILRFMHSFFHKTLPISFHDRWITNREKQPERALRNADLLYIPQHNFARMPMFNFPCIWNEAGPDKNNPNQFIYLRNVKSLFFSHCCYNHPHPPHHPPTPTPPPSSPLHPPLCSLPLQLSSILYFAT